MGEDLELAGARGRVVVQCKHRSGSVGVDVVRALFGVMVREQADRAMLVTSGSFTDAARAFAAGKPLELIDGVALARLIQQTRKPASGALALHCEHCGQPIRGSGVPAVPETDRTPDRSARPLRG